jgi:hypothetical protein
MYSWGVWANVRGASIMLPWPSPIRDENILTPLPHAPEDYLTGAIHHLPDISLRDLYELPYAGASPPNYTYGLMMASIHLLNRAKSVREEPTLLQATYRSLQHNTALSRCPRLDNPSVYTEIMDATNHFFAKLPPSARLDTLSSAQWTNFDVPMIVSRILPRYRADIQLVYLISVRMHLHDPEGDEYDRETCLSAAKESASIIKPWIQQLRLDSKQNLSRNGAPPLKLSSRDRNGVAGPYVLVPWFWTVDRLVRSARVLKTLGRVREADDLEGDAAAVVQGLKEQGVLYPMSGDGGV